MRCWLSSKNLLLESSQPMTDPLFKKTCIIGLGLIGSSLALAMRDNNLCPDIGGADLSQSVCDEAIALGVVGAAAPKIPQAVKGCDLIISGCSGWDNRLGVNGPQ